MRVVNPIAQNLSVMRSTLVGSLVEALKVNLARKATRLRLFELGKVYLRDAGASAGPTAVAGVHQPLKLGGLAFGAAAPLQWGEAERPVDFFDVKGDLEALFAPLRPGFVPVAHPALHPGRSAAIELDGARVGFVGELHPRWRQAYELPGNAIVFELDAAALMRRSVPTFEPLPKQQPAVRDLAVVAKKSVTHQALKAAVEAGAAGVVRASTLFDIYEPKTPVPGIADDERIESVVAGVLASLESRLGVRLRAQ